MQGRRAKGRAGCGAPPFAADPRLLRADLAALLPGGNLLAGGGHALLVRHLCQLVHADGVNAQRLGQAVAVLGVGL